MFKTALNPNRNLCWKRRASSLALRFEDQKWAPIKSSRVLSMPVTRPKTNLKPKIGGFEDHFPLGVIFGFHVRFRESTVYTVNHNQRPASSSDVYLTFSMAFLREGAMYIWSIANWQSSQFWTVAAQTNAQRSVEATDWSSISNLKATDQADPLHNCHSPLLRSGRVRLWFQFWSQSFQSRCQEANQHSVMFFVRKIVKNQKKLFWTYWKTPMIRIQKILESLCQGILRDHSLRLISISASSESALEASLGSLGASKCNIFATWFWWICSMDVMIFMVFCFRFNRFSLDQKSLTSGVGSTCFVSELFSCGCATREYSWNAHGLGQVECTQTSPSNKKMHLFARQVELND